jgi:SLT domain-containing protein
VKNRRPITEDDVYLTELLIAKSYGNLKHSVARASSDALSSVGDAVGGSIRKHPYATAGAAVGAGLLMFMFFKLMNRGRSSRRRKTSEREDRVRSNMTTDILGMLIPLAAPYFTAYLEKSLGRMFSKGRD